MKRYLNEIESTNKEELLKILNANEKLLNDVCEDYEEGEMFYISEILDCFKNALSDWAIGFSCGNYVSIKDNDIYNLCEGLKDATKSYGFLNNEELKVVDQLQELNSRLYEMNYDNKQWDNLENKVDELIKEVESIIVNKFNKICTYDRETIKNYFLDFYFDERLDHEEMYIDDDYVLYEEVSYIKSYA